MIPEKLFLQKHLFDPKNLEQQATRDGFGHGLVQAGELNDKIVALCADLAESTRTHWFKESFPNRYVELGVAEQNLAAVASGMANYGKIPFIMSYAAFSPGRNWEQIRSTICLNDVPVKIVGAHAGVSVGPDGATHQALEDIALTRVLPNMIVVVPADAQEARKATLAVADNKKPSYLRLARAKTPVFTTEKTPFEIGQATMVYQAEEPRVGIVACGSLVYQSMLAAEELAKKGIHVSVLNMSTIKPLDGHALIDLAKSVDHIVTAEEHQIAGGLGGAVAEFLSEHYPISLSRIGMHDRYGESGDPDTLLEYFGFTKDGIIRHIKKHL
jgi:transketolase